MSTNIPYIGGDSPSGLTREDELIALYGRGIVISEKIRVIGLTYIRDNAHNELTFEIAHERVKRAAYRSIERVFSGLEGQLKEIMNDTRDSGFNSQIKVANYAMLARDTIQLNLLIHALYSQFLKGIPPYYTRYPEVNPVYK